MDSAVVSIQSVLVLLASSVLAVVVCRSLQLPPMIGYLVTGLALGPHALGLVSDIEETRRLAEFGVVFLMFSIGLEFSLPKLLAMRRAVFGLGLAQVAATIALAVGAALAAGASWQAGLTLGGIAAMSSTAMVSKLLAERLELDTAHGRQVIGMLLFQDLAVVPLLVLLPALDRSADALGAAVAIALGKAVLALAVGIALAQAGEFGFVLLSLAAPTRVVPEPVLQGLLAAMILSMLATPFLIAASDRIVMRLSGAEWMLRSLELHRIAAQSIEVERHVIVLGYGRNGQRLARLLDAEGVRYVALDLDAERVREAALAGDAVVFADSSRREALVAAGIARAAGVVVTFADVDAAVRVLTHIHALNPAVPVIVRARDEDDIPRLTAAGASEVVPEAFESGVMLASHTLVLVGVPLSRVMRRMSQVRGEQYQLLRGLFYGSGDELEGNAEALARLHSVTLDERAQALGRPLAQLGLDALGVQVRAVRRRGARSKLTAAGAGALQAGDVVVLLGDPESLAAAEVRLLRG